MIVNRHHLQSPVEIIEAQLNIPQDYKQECINEIYKIGNTNSEPSNVHGIRSTYKVWKETKILDPLLNYIQNTINELYKSKFTGDYFSISSSWSIIYKKDDYAKPHIHLPNTWAFVYYLKSSGRTPIIFNDINDLQQLNFKLIYHRTWFMPEDRDKIINARHSEILVKDKLLLKDNLKLLVVRSEAEKETLLYQVNDDHCSYCPFGNLCHQVSN